MYTKVALVQTCTYQGFLGFSDKGALATVTVLFFDIRSPSDAKTGGDEKQGDKN